MLHCHLPVGCIASYVAFVFRAHITNDRRWGKFGWEQPEILAWVYFSWPLRTFRSLAMAGFSAKSLTLWSEVCLKLHSYLFLNTNTMARSEPYRIPHQESFHRSIKSRSQELLGAAALMTRRFYWRLRHWYSKLDKKRGVIDKTVILRDESIDYVRRKSQFPS